MSYIRLANKVLSSKWAIEPSMLASILTVLHSRMAGEAVSPEVLASFPVRPNARLNGVSRYAQTSAGPVLVPAPDENDDEPEHEEETAAASDAPASIAVIFGSGILGKHLSSMDEVCAGGLSVDRLQADLAECAADPAIKHIVLWLDTPGGVVTGIPETADLVGRIRQTKTVVAYCDSLCASAGYWIASACDAIYCTRSADLGSIGVYSALMDISAYYAKEGVKVELFKDGIYKAAGFPGTSLTDEQRKEILDGVLECSREFKADVTARRPQVKADTMQGQCFTGESAVKAGLADDLVSSLDDVLTDLAHL